MSPFLRGALLVGAAAAVALAPPAAAGTTVTLRADDLRGDANGINGQGVVPGVGNHAGGVQRTGADITSLTLAATRRGSACTVRATIELAAPPEADAIYRLLGRGTRNARRFWLQHDTSALKPRTELRHSDGEAGGTLPLARAEVRGNRITMTITDVHLRAAGERPEAFVLYDIGLEIRWSTGETTAPVWDAIEEDPDRLIRPCRAGR